MGERTSTDTWYRRLGHPAQKIVSHIVKQFSLPLRNSIPPNNCTSCRLSKSHKLPFGTSSIVSRNPLEYIFYNVWGPTQIQSSDGYRYYVIVIDHYTHYYWFFPMHQKSDVYQIFTHLKPVLEKQFDHPIKNFYKDNGGEYIKLKTYFLNHGISHLTTPPDTPQHNGISERRHRHIVETGMTLLTQAALPTTYWPYAFQTAIYLINGLPSLALKYSSPYERLFGTSPNFLKLRTFGCLCFPWLKPYTGHKLDSKSRACIFLGYSTSQSAYKCLDFATSRLYLSRHVQFNENEFPSLCLKPPSEPIHTSPPTVVSPHLSIIPIDMPNVSSNPVVESSPNPTRSHHSQQQPLDPSPSQTTLPTSLDSNPSATSGPSEPSAPILTHGMITRAMNNIYRPKQIYQVSKHSLPPALEPTCVSQAMKYPLLAPGYE